MATDKFLLEEGAKITWIDTPLGEMTGILKRGGFDDGYSSMKYLVQCNNSKGRKGKSEDGIMPTGLCWVSSGQVTAINDIPVVVSGMGEVLYIKAKPECVPPGALERDFLAWKIGLEPRPDNETLPPVISALTALQYDKEGTYGSSWKGKGEYRGIVANIDRKYDRLDKITNDEIEGTREPLPKKAYNELSQKEIEDMGESKIDAVADLTNYSLLYLAYLRIQYPGAFQVWVTKNIPSYLRSKIPFL